MRLKLNGEFVTVQAETVAQLLRELNAPESGVAVAQNGAVVRRFEYSKSVLQDDDEIEIIRAVQGG